MSSNRFHDTPTGAEARGWGLSFGILLLAAVVLTWPSASIAHRLNNSRTVVLVRVDSLKLELAIDETDLLVAFDVDGNGDGILWRAEMMAAAPVVTDFVSAHLRLWADGEELKLESRSAYVAPDGRGNLYLHLGLAAALVRDPLALAMEVDLFEAFSEGHKNLVMVRAHGGSPQPAVFSATARRHKFVLREEQNPRSQPMGLVSSPADHPLAILVAAAALAGLVVGIVLWVRR